MKRPECRYCWLILGVLWGTVPAKACYSIKPGYSIFTLSQMVSKLLSALDFLSGRMGSDLALQDQNLLRSAASFPPLQKTQEPALRAVEGKGTRSFGSAKQERV